MMRTPEQDLVRALEAATGALVAVQKALGATDDTKVRFTGEWEHLGSRSLGSILDQASGALGRAKQAEAI